MKPNFVCLKHITCKGCIKGNTPPHRILIPIGQATCKIIWGEYKQAPHVICHICTVLELASLEKKKKENYDFFEIRFLGFYKAELKSEDIICTQEGQGFQMISILLALGLVFMPFHPYLLYCQHISTTLIPTQRSLPRSLILIFLDIL